MKSTVRELPPDRIDLWYTFQDEIVASSLIERYHALLAPEEEEQRRRFVFAHLRHEYLVTRALCRGTLSRYAGVDPAAWEFVRNEYGRPEISAPALSIPLRFNLSNTKGLIACCVARGYDVGVDVENMDRPGETVRIAGDFFSTAEVRDLLALDEQRQRERFFEYWTLKESYIKARGMGLSIPLDQFSFHLGGGEIRISFDPRLGDDPTAWQFELFRPSPQHMMAVGVRRGQRADLAIDARQTVPLLAD